MGKQVILTGLRANNDLTIGNYFGAILPMIDMATTRSEEYQVNLFVPDLHSFTTPIDHAKLQEAIWNNLRIFVAAGLPLDMPDIHIYRQSYIPAHSELAWILGCFTGFGEMSRMTQFKDKSTSLRNLDLKRADTLEVIENNPGEASVQVLQKSNSVSIGLFNYPVLMAADILLYGATYVPVGDDQTQHLEFTRDIAERMNRKFDQELFVVPKPVKEQHAFFGKDQGLRIMDLQEPSKKMSKSDESGKGVIFLNDDPEVAAKKIMSAATDSEGIVREDWKTTQPGIANLLQILALLRQRDLTETGNEWVGQTRYGDLKAVVAEEMKRFLANLQNNLRNVQDDAITAKLAQSEEAMSMQASKTLYNVQKAVGLRA